jgi:hypothetical protein
MTSWDSSKGKYDNDNDNEKSGVTYLRIDDNQGSRRKTDMETTEELRKNISLFESIPENIRL